MKRIAYLIGSPLDEGESGYLQGVEIDMKNYYNFLRSSIGGAWKDEEIIIPNLNPSIDELESIKDYSKGADLVIVIFTGHGFSNNNTSYININRDKVVPESFFHNLGKRQLILLDSCRTFQPYSGYTGKISGPIEQTLMFDNSYLDYSRAIYEELISRIPTGTITVYASELGTAAKDTEQGGAFSKALLHYLLGWQSGHSGSLNLYNAISRATKKLAPMKQKPEIYITSEDMLSLPFAINPKAIIKNNRRKRTSPSRQKYNPNAVGLAFTTFATIALVSLISRG